MFSPPLITMSLILSTINKKGPSNLPISPDLNQPWAFMHSFVASSFFQYPNIFDWDLIATSPISPSGNSFQLESIIFISVNGGTTLPAEDGFWIYSSPLARVPNAFVSVNPYPIPGLPLKFSSKSFTCSAGLGPPPPPNTFKEERSYLSLSGWFNNSQVCVGTPVISDTFSSLISLIASPASHFFIITTFLPTKIDIRNATWLPVAWNKGTHNRIEDSELANGVASLPSLASLWLKTVEINAQLNIEDMTPRCDDKTPFGFPVDPEV